MEVERMVRSAHSGDRTAMADLCEYFHPQLHRFFMRLTASPADADDLSQATLLKMMEKLETFHFLPGRRFEGWLFRIAYRLFIDSKRRDRYLPLDDELPSPDPSPGAEELISREESIRSRGRFRLPQAFRSDRWNRPCEQTPPPPLRSSGSAPP